MIPGLSGVEFLAIAIIAILIIPSKDLPKAAREAGKQWVRLKHQISNIRMQFDKAMADAELEEIKAAGGYVSDAMKPLQNPKQAAKNYVSKAISAEQLDIKETLDTVQDTVRDVVEQADLSAEVQQLDSEISSALAEEKPHDNK